MTVRPVRSEEFIKLTRVSRQKCRRIQHNCELKRRFSSRWITMLGQLVTALDVTTVIVFLLTCFLFYFWLTSPKNLPPGPIRLPVVGSILSLALSDGDFLKVLDKFRHKYGDVITLQLGSLRFVILNSYEAIHEAFVKKGDIFSGRPCNLYTLKKINEMGIGIVFNEGPIWKDLRRVTMTTMREFGVGKKSLEKRVQEEAHAIMDVLDKCQGQEVNMKPLLAKGTSNIMCSIIFGSRFEYDDPKFIDLLSLLDESFKTDGFFVPINFFPFLRFFPLAFTRAEEVMTNSKIKLDTYLQTLLTEHEATYNPDQICDFVDLYIKTSQESNDKHVFTAKNMRTTIMELFGAGTESSSTTLDWLILYMVQFTQVQERCQQEIDQAVGQVRMIGTEDRPKLPYVEAVICEIMRLVPVVPLGLAHVAIEQGSVAGYTIPPETLLLPNILAVHRDPKVWPDPLAFKPERFLDQQGLFCAPKENWLPFSIGPRICAGEALARMEMFILFSTLLQFYTFTMANGRTPDLEGHLGMTYSARDQSVMATRR